jgi:hypothetical protein
MAVALRGIPALEAASGDRAILESGRRVSYGARAINEGGWQSVPKLIFPGGALIGCSAGFVNVPRIKGSHTAMKSGMLAAEAAYTAIAAGRGRGELTAYPKALEASWVATELKLVRNAEPAVARFGGTLGTLVAGVDMWMRHLGIGLPFTLHHKHRDAETLEKASQRPRIDYPKPDSVISFDRLSSVFLSGVNHREDQPVHLNLKDPSVPINVNLRPYEAPEQRYCPAGVYEIVGRDEGTRACRSMRRTVSTARPATSRTLPRTSTGSLQKAAEDQTTRTCRSCVSAYRADAPSTRYAVDQRQLARHLSPINYLLQRARSVPEEPSCRSCPPKSAEGFLRSRSDQGVRNG